MSKLRLAMACSNYDRTRALFDTKILTDLTHQPGEISAEAICHLSEACQKLENPAGSEQRLQTLEQRAPQSPWFEKALFSLGNYYLVHRCCLKLL